ncbi:hypothetical protein RDI58_000664 [Solanum bulbocastanum]|uniref:GAG-pre-integrase domain-containing protein n=1 Tax=Solanum bulbocastanum TaxID=147425 RepID=A0AAN8UAK2_SOLBU
MILLVQDQVTSSLSSNIRNYLGSKITQTPLVNVYLTWQGLYNVKVLGIGREGEGLYLLKEYVTPTTNAISFKHQAEGILWHLRLGHPSSTVMHHIPFISKYVSNNIQYKCHILAKHHRSSFPTSSSKTLACFDLIHVDLWKPTYDKKYYFVTIIDDYNKYKWICLLHSKNVRLLLS